MSTWTDPGTTKGTPDRYQTASVSELFLTAGHNARSRESGYTEFVRPATKTPWHVYAELPHPDNPHMFKLTEVAGGIATSQELARDAAENAARAYTSAQCQEDAC